MADQSTAVLPGAASEHSLELDHALMLFRKADTDRSGLLNRAQFDSLMNALHSSAEVPRAP